MNSLTGFHLKCDYHRHGVRFDFGDSDGEVNRRCVLRYRAPAGRDAPQCSIEELVLKLQFSFLQELDTEQPYRVHLPGVQNQLKEAPRPVTTRACLTLSFCLDLKTGLKILKAFRRSYVDSPEAPSRPHRSEILIGVRQLHESLENIQKTFLNCIDGSCDITRAAVAEGIGTFRKTIQDNFATIKESIANQTELMKSQTCREMKDNEEKTSLALKELSSLVLNLQRDLDSLKLEQSKEQSVLGEILSLLSTVMTARSAGTQPGPVQMIDNTVQTSPSLVTQFCVVSEEKRYYEGSKAFNFSGEKVDLSICPVTHTSPEKLSRGAPFRVIGTQPFQMKRDIATERCDPNGWKKSYRLHPVTVNSPNPVATFTDPAHIQDPKKDYMFGHPVHIERVNSLNDMTKNNSAAWIEVPREKKIAKRAQRCQTFRKKKRALILPQRRPDQGKVLNNVFEESQHDEDQENRVPNLVVNGYRKAIRKSVVSGKHVPLQQPSTTRLSNTNECVQNLDPCSLSQSSNSSQMIVEYQQAEWETVNPEQKANTIKTQRVTWQLFDFISDSD
ncbi:interactor of HORMAD1 protein 1 isoform X2 [Tachysurus fulvidraco]|uniref:interactor of HORMAD1 protein 1 isoform X2 n=1 Tax=Tachysurus fulvidraco TaxID=1234273 RepID=UPI001FEE148C|nr:interactor of HORMAD1 protein 1 isoform X2 [Tachysurus fulvidraco]